MALLATGTGNDFAKTVGAPARDFAATARLAVNGSEMDVDVGRIENKYFLNVSGFGFDIAVLEDIERISWLKGDLLYLYSALRQLFSYGGIEVGIASARKRRESRRHLMLIVANARNFGGSFRIAPARVGDRWEARRDLDSRRATAVAHAALRRRDEGDARDGAGGHRRAGAGVHARVREAARVRDRRRVQSRRRRGCANRLCSQGRCASWCREGNHVLGPDPDVPDDAPRREGERRAVRRAARLHAARRRRSARAAERSVGARAHAHGRDLRQRPQRHHAQGVAVDVAILVVPVRDWPRERW